MKYTVQITEYNDDFEFLLNNQIHNRTLLVFSSSIPFPIDFKKNYIVDLEAIVFDEYVVEQITSSPQIRQIDDSLQYEIIGFLDNGKIKTNDLIFEDSILKIDFSYLDQTIVKWRVDRISVDFETNH